MKQYLMILLTLILLFTACAPTGGEPAAGEPADPLDGTAWILTDFSGVALPDGAVVTVEFADGQMSGISACNSYGGAYEIVDGAIVVDEMASTLMACLDEGIMELESQVQQALMGISGFSVSDDTLTLETEVGTMTFEPQTAASLEGTPWTLGGIATNDAVVSTWVDESITATFADGRLTGSAGCNTYMADYTVDGESLTIGPTASTRMSCDEERNQRETEFLTALANVAGYKTDRTTLTLTGADGNMLLRFYIQQ